MSAAPDRRVHLFEQERPLAGRFLLFTAEMQSLVVWSANERKLTLIFL